MGIYQLNVFRSPSRLFDGLYHGFRRSQGFGVRCGDMVGIAVRPESFHLPINSGTPPFCVFQFLEDQNAGSFTHDEPVSMDVERP